MKITKAETNKTDKSNLKLNEQMNQISQQFNAGITD